MALLVKEGYGQVEPNRLSAQMTGQIYAQKVANDAITVLENGSFLKYNGSTTGYGEFYLVYNEIKLYNNLNKRYKDFALLSSGSLADEIVPRLFKINDGDVFTTNLVNVTTTAGLRVGKLLVPRVSNFVGVLTESTLADINSGDMVFEILAETTMADGQYALKVMKKYTAVDSVGPSFVSALINGTLFSGNTGTIYYSDAIAHDFTTFSWKFNEQISLVTGEDAYIKKSNVKVGTFIVSGDSLVITMDSAAFVEGIHGYTLAAGTIVDESGNTNEATAFTLTLIDLTKPALAEVKVNGVVQESGDTIEYTDPTSFTSFTWEFDQPIALVPLAVNDITDGTDPIGDFVITGGNTLTITLDTVAFSEDTFDYVLPANIIKDAAGNTNEATTVTLTFVATI